MKSFEPGAFPGHCYAVLELEFAATHLIRTLSGIVSAQPVFANALKQLGAFFSTISDPAACMLSVHDYVQRVDPVLAGLKPIADMIQPTKWPNQNVIPSADNRASQIYTPLKVRIMVYCAL